MSEPYRIELTNTLRDDRLPVEQVYADRDAAQIDRYAVSVDLSQEGLAKSAAGGKSAEKAGKLGGKEKVGEGAPEQEGAFKQAFDAVLRATVGIGADELHQAVERGELPQKVSLKWADPIGNTMHALARKTAIDSGVEPDVAEKMAAAVSVIGGLVFPPGTNIKHVADAAEKGAEVAARGAEAVGRGVAKVGEKARDVAEDVTAGARAQKILAILKEQRGSMLLPGGSREAPKLGSGAAGASNVNTARVQATESVKKTMEAISASQAEKLAGARQTTTHAQTVAESKRYSFEDVMAFDPATVDVRAIETRVRDFYNASATHVDKLMRAAGKGDAAAAEELVNAFLVSGELAAKDELLGKGLARGLEARKIMSEAMRVPFTPESIAALRSQYDTLEATADRGFALARRLEALTKTQREQFAREAVEQLREGRTNRLYSAWINALVSGPQTHVANVLSNAMTSVWAIPERVLAANLHVGMDPGVMRGEASAMFFAISEGFTDGLRAAGTALKTGVSSFGPEKLDIVPRQVLDSTTGRAGEYLSMLLPTRWLTTEDAFFKALNYRMEVAALAYREARLQGLEGAEAAKFIARVKNHPQEFQGIHENAERFALIQTFNNELGPAGQAIMNARDKIPGARLILPFVRTPANLMSWTAQRMGTPGALAVGGLAGGALGEDVGERIGGETGAKVGRVVGSVAGAAAGVRGNLAMLQTQMMNDIRAGGVARDLALGKIAAGSMIAAVGTTLAAKGVITGGGPKNKDLQRELRETGWQPYSLKVGNTYYSFSRLDPVLGQTLGIVADAAEIIGQMPQQEATDLATAIGLAVSKHLVSKTYLEGLSNVLEAMEAPEEKGRKIIEGLARSTVPTAVRTVTRTLDPTLKETRDIMDQVRAGIPGWAQTLPPRRNLWGDPIRLEGGWGPDIASPIYTATVKDDPVANEIIRNRVALTLPPKFVAGPRESRGVQTEMPSQAPGLELTPEEYDRYVVLTGKGIQGKPPLKDALAQMMQTESYQRQSDGPDGGKALLIKTWVNTYKEAALVQLRQEFPELHQALKEHTEEKIQRLLPKGDARGRPPAQAPGLLKAIGGSLAR